MQRLLLLFLLISFILPQYVNAQVNSASLKDGSGNLLSQHSSITSAYNMIPATLTQAYIIELSSTYDGSNEVYPIVFIPKVGASITNTITLRPEAGVTAVSITSTMTGETLLRLDDADFIIIDGRPGGTGTSKALTINNQGTSTTSYGIQLINGASNNYFRYFNVTGFFSASSGGKGIYIGASANNPSGNSDNTFEFLTLGEGPRYHINSSGTIANKNRNLKVYGCEFKNIKFCGWWQQNGTGKVSIDSCFFYNDILGGGTSGTGVFAILSDFQSDTTIVTRNHIYNIDNSSNTTDVIGMSFRSFNIGSVLRVYNNMISLMVSNPSVDELFGIELGTNTMNNPVDAEIYYNTVRIGGTATGGTAGNVNSAAFSIDEANAGSTINVRNNIFVNERTGGNEHHLAINLTEFSGSIILNHNTYDASAPDFAKYLTTVYQDFINYQSALAPQETNSNSTAVQFVSTTDLHLTGTSLGNTALQGTNIPSVTTDIDNDIRSFPYRGADEAFLEGCFDPQLTHSVNLFTPAAICAGDSAGLAVVWNTLDTISSVNIQWQVSTDGVTFNDIPNANSDTLYAFPQVKTYYRYRLTCQSTGSVLVSIDIDVQIIPPPTLTAINQSINGLTYNFVAVSSPNVTNYSWDFGDGNSEPNGTSTSTHTYAAAGSYIVTLIATNNCGSDTITKAILITNINEVSNTEPDFILYPNPTFDYIYLEGKNLISVEIINMLGKIIFENEYYKVNELVLETNTLEPGFYFIKVKTSEGIAVRKIEIIK
ncbi:MAG: PKD domain-containing protein [Bacteroidia bacterium]